MIIKNFPPLPLLPLLPLFPLLPLLKTYSVPSALPVPPAGLYQTGLMSHQIQHSIEKFPNLSKTVEKPDSTAFNPASEKNFFSVSQAAGAAAKIFFSPLPL